MRVDVNTFYIDRVPMVAAGQSNHLVRLPEAIYMFYVNTTFDDIYWSKSTNKGLTWSTPTLIKTTIVAGIAVWYDGWTPGDSGTLIHLAYYEIATHDVFYRSLDTASDTLGTEVTVFAGASANNDASTCLSIAKAKGGNIYVAFDIDGGTETGFYRSTDSGATFGSRTDVNEATSDYYHLAPGNYADTNDIDCIFWDRSANEISLKIYDDSANSWGETSIATSMTDIATTSVCPNFAITIRPSDSHLILVAWSASDTVNADLRCWDINGSGSITEVTNVVLNSVDDQCGCAISIDTDNNYLYVFYLGKSDGSETAYTALNVYYKVSQDDGATWGTETLLTSAVRQITLLQNSLTFRGGEFAVMYGYLQFYTSAIIPNKQPQMQIGI